MSLVCFFMWNS